MMKQVTAKAEKQADGTWKIEAPELGISVVGDTEQAAREALNAEVQKKAGGAGMHLVVRPEKQDDGTWKVDVPRLGISVVGDTAEAALEAFNAEAKKKTGGGSGQQKLPTKKEQLPDGSWKVSWDEVGLEGFGATAEEAGKSFADELQKNMSNPAVAAALSKLTAQGGSDITPPSPEIPEDYAALPNLTEADFDEAIASDTPVLVDFWASWCRPCLMMAPALVALQEEFGDRLRVVKVDVQSETALAQRCEIAAIPILLLYRKGELLHRVVGARGIDDLREQISPFLT